MIPQFNLKVMKRALGKRGKRQIWSPPIHPISFHTKTVSGDVVRIKHRLPPLFKCEIIKQYIENDEQLTYNVTEILDELIKDGSHNIDWDYDLSRMKLIGSRTCLLIYKITAFSYADQRGVVGQWPPNIKKIFKKKGNGIRDILVRRLELDVDWKYSDFYYSKFDMNFDITYTVTSSI